MALGYIPNWSEEGFVIKIIKNTVTWTYFITALKAQEIFGMFHKKEFQKHKSNRV